jgi:hypothetical protein
MGLAVAGLLVPRALDPVSCLVAPLAPAPVVGPAVRGLEVAGPVAPRALPPVAVLPLLVPAYRFFTPVEVLAGLFLVLGPLAAPCALVLVCLPIVFGLEVAGPVAPRAFGPVAGPSVEGLEVAGLVVPRALALVAGPAVEGLEVAGLVAPMFLLPALRVS